MQLHQLKNGDWIYLISVSELYALPFTERVAAHMEDIPPRVVVKTFSGGFHIIMCESMAQAERYRDELANAVNNCRPEPQQKGETNATTKIH